MSDEPSAGRIEGRVHRLPVRVYYEDTDFTGLVYHANYLRFFERGRSDFLRAVGISHVELAAADTAFAVTRIDIRYLKAARIDNALTVLTSLDTASGARMTFAQSLLRGEELVSSATVEVCCISMTGRAKRAPPLLVDKLNPYLEPKPSMF
jgi:acyl-CoA thioester hydrolase